MNRLNDTGPDVNLVYFDSTNPPPALWTKTLSPSRSGICSNLACHGSDALDWYGTDTTTYQDCVTCHAYAIRSRRQVVGAQGDFGGNTSIISHHVSGGDPTNAQCLVCHDQSTHTLGTVRLRNADSGATIIYDPADPATLEPFCLSCHDANGASGNMNPFSDGIVMGAGIYQASSTIQTSWNKTYGHRRQGLTCVGNGNPGTGCHASGHGSSHVGLLSKNMTLPAPVDIYRESDYQLCFDCHAFYPNVTKEVVFGVNYAGSYYGGYGPGFGFPPYNIPAISTRFKDRNNQGTANAYDDTGNIWIDFWLWGYDLVNLHWVHITWPAWDYRGSPSLASGISCTTCHNVHGANNPFSMTHDEMLYQHYSGAGSDQYARMGAVSPYTLDQFPVNCTYGCHRPTAPGFGVSSAWFEPSNE